MAASNRTVVFILGAAGVVAGVAYLMRSSSNTRTLAIPPASLKRRVYHRERAAGVVPELQAFLTWWEANGPFPISVDPQGGVRSDEAAQQALHAKGASNAASLKDTPHGRGGALDLYPVLRGNPDTGAVLELASDAKSPELFAQLGAIAQQHGLAWGGLWSSLKDLPHVEVRNWKSLPFPPGVA